MSDEEEKEWLMWVLSTLCSKASKIWVQPYSSHKTTLDVAESEETKMFVNEFKDEFGKIFRIEVQTKFGRVSIYEQKVSVTHNYDENIAVVPSGYGVDIESFRVNPNIEQPEPARKK